MAKDAQKQIDRAELRTLKKSRKKVRADLTALEKECRAEERRLARMLASGRERCRKATVEIDARIGILEGRLH